MPRPSVHSRSSSGSTVKQSEKHSGHGERKSYLKSPYWWAGIILMVIGEAGNFLAYGFAPASIVSPLGVVALVSNCIIAPCLLRERFRFRDFFGVVVAIAGAVVVVLSAKNLENKMGPKELWSHIARWEFALYMGITAFVIIGLMWASGKYGERTILIDLGLVGLWGKISRLSTCYRLTFLRRLHCAFYQRDRIPPLLHTVARPDLPNYLPPTLRFSRLSSTADPIPQPRPTTV